MRVIYSAFDGKMLSEIQRYINVYVDVKPVYILSDNAEQINVEYSSALVHSIRNSRCGIPHEKYSKCLVGVDDDGLFSFMLQYRDMALSMMGRQAETGWDFSYTERDHLFTYLISYWAMVIADTRPNVLISRNIPHFASEFILFRVCEYYGVPCVTKEDVDSLNLSYLIVGLNDRSPYIGLNNLSENKESLNKYHSGLIDNFIDKNRANYSIAKPKYYIEVMGMVGRVRTKKYLLQRLLKDVVVSVLYIGKRPSVTIKRTRRPVYDTRSMQTYLSLKLHQWKVGWMINKNEKLYDSLASAGKPDQPYVLLAVNYQPERTTMPDAGEFHDIVRLVDAISGSLPDGWLLLYKEHPSVFTYPGVFYRGHPLFYRGHLFRGEEYYRTLSKYSNLRFVDYRADIFDLIDSSEAVCSATGTVAYQANLRGKKAIIFGENWFSECKAVYKYRSHKELKEFFLSENLCSDEIDKHWRGHLHTVCSIGFKTPELLKSDPDFVENNREYLKALAELLVSINQQDSSEKTDFLDQKVG